MADEIYRSPYTGAQIDNAIQKVIDGTIASEAATAASAAASIGAQAAQEAARGVEEALDAFDWIPTKNVQVVGETIFPETSVRFTSGLSSISGVGSTEIKPGYQYVVYWRGTMYECTAFSAAGSTILGNGSLLGVGEDTGEPFAIEVLTSTYCSIASNLTGTMSVAIRIDAVEVADYNKMPEGYMPEYVRSIIMRSSTRNSVKLFRITIDDTGTLRATEVTE